MALTHISTPASYSLGDDIPIRFGGGAAQFIWETADANANALLLQLPTGGATDVPVFIIGDASALDVDLGMFNGVTQPLVATLDADQDSYVGFHYSGDDVGIITMRLGSGGTIRNHVIPDVASSTIAVLGAAQTWSGAQTFSADPQVNADLDFVGPQAITTTSGALTITPATDTLFSNGTGVVLGHTAKIAAAGYTAELQVLGTTDDTDSVALIAGFSNDGGGPKLVFGKARGGSIGTFTAVQNGDDVGTIFFNAADGTDLASAVAQIHIEIDGAPGANDTPGLMSFRTTAAGAFSVTERLRLDSSGRVFINDSANGTQTLGLTINQGANDNQILALKSSDVATGLTTLPTGQDVETDDVFTISKTDAAEGGVRIQIMAESSYQSPLILETWSGDPSTTDTSSSLGAMNFFCGSHNGSNADVDMAADTNAFAVGEIDSSNARLTRMLLKADDGELHLGNVTLGPALDSEDDIHLVRAMQRESATGGFVESEYDNPYYDYSKLHELGLAGEKDKEGFYLFPLQSRLHAHEGTMWQTYCQMMEMGKTVTKLRDKLELAERKLEAIGD